MLSKMLVVLVLVVVLSSVNSYQCSSRYVTKLLRSSLRSSSSSTTTTASSSWQEDIDSILNIDTTCDNRRDNAINLLKKSSTITNDIIDSIRQRDLSKVAPSSLAYGRTIIGIQQFQKQLVNDIIPELLTKTIPKVIENTPTIINDIVKKGSADDAIKKSNELISTIIKLPNDPSLLQSTIDDIRKEVKNIYQSTPEGLDTPNYDVIKKTEYYEIRKYSSYSVCSIKSNDVDDVSSSESSNKKDTTTDLFTSGNNFNTLAGYIFGDNASERKMSMTTPVIMKGSDVMEFVLPNGMDATKAPAPKSSNIILKDVPSEIIAVKEFSGICTEAEIARQRTLLEDTLLSDGILYDNLSFSVLQYNPPYTLPWVRRNEVSLKIDMDINEITGIVSLEQQNDINTTTDSTPTDSNDEIKKDEEEL